MNEIILSTAVTVIIGIIGYFLKRTMSRVDKHDADVEKIKDETVKKRDHEKNISELKGEIKQIKEDYTPKKVHEKDFDECRADIKHIKSEYLTKDDFIREINKMDRKLDRMMEMMIEATRKG